MKYTAVGSFIFKRLLHNKVAIREFISANQHIASSTLFQGTLYEYTVMKELNEKLAVKNLTRVGGSNDKGVDIIGDWDIPHIHQRTNSMLSLADIKVPKKCKIWNTTLKPLRNDLDKINEDSIRVLVQCKAFKSSKVAPKELRELVGTYSAWTTREKHKIKPIVVMSSPNLLTKEGLKLINSVHIPLIYLRVQMLKIPKEGVEHIEYEHSGKLLNYYENKYASTFLQGLGIKEWLKLGLYAEE